MAVTERHARVMACDLHLIVHDSGARASIDDAVDLLRHLEARWSRFVPDSDISRINAGAGTPVGVQAETIELVETMKRGWHLTQGRYDPTILPVLVAVGYAASREDPAAVTTLPPGPRRIGATGEVDVDHQQRTVTVPQGVALDPGGIGKGLAADAAVALLRAGGAAGALVSIGGDLTASGLPPDPDGWRIDVEHAEPADTPLCRVTIDHGGVATSSTRSRRWYHDGRIRHHAIDPVTGTISDTDLAAVTVFAATGWQAEAFATAALLTGSASVTAFLESHDLSGLAIADTGAVLRTDDLDAIEILDLADAR